MQNLNIINTSQEEIKKPGLFLVKDYVCDVCSERFAHITRIKFLQEDFALCDRCLSDHFRAKKVKSPLDINVLQSPL